MLLLIRNSTDSTRCVEPTRVGSDSGSTEEQSIPEKGSPNEGCVEAAGAWLPEVPGHTPQFLLLRAPNTSFQLSIINAPVSLQAEEEASLISHVWLRELSELHLRENLYSSKSH